jgi:hypothetical protein
MQTMPIGKTSQSFEATVTGLDPSRLNVVLIEPTAANLPDRRFLLANEQYRVTCVRDTRELGLLRTEEAFALALISDALGQIGLIDAARSVRKQWPAARILVLGEAAVVLEDYLYEEALPHSCGQQEFCDTLLGMFNSKPHGRPFIVTTPAAERDCSQRRQTRSVSDVGGPGTPERMTQMQS